MFCKNVVSKILKSPLTCTMVRHKINDSYSTNQQWNRINFYSQSCVKNKNHDNHQKSSNTNRTYILFGPSAMFFGLFGTEKTEEEKKSDVVITIKRSILLIQKGEFKKAEQMLHVALRQAQALQNYDAVTYIYDVMANLAFDTGDFVKAEKLFVTVLQRLMSTGTTQDDLKVVHISLKLAKIFEQTGENQKAADGYHFCIQQLSPYIEKHPEDEDALTLWAMTLDWYARLLLSQSKLTEAFQYFLEAYKMCVRVNGEEHEQTVILLNDLGTVCCMQGQHDQAIHYLSTAMEIGRKLPDMVDLGSIHVNLGNVYIKKGLYDEAKKYCLEGMKMSKKRKDEESLTEANNCLEEIKKLTA